MFLDARKPPRWQKLTIGKFFEAIFIAANTGKLLNMAVPRSDVLISYWPIDGKAISCRTLKIEIAPSLSLSGPHDALPSNLITADPIEWLLLDVRVIVVLHEE